MNPLYTDKLFENSKSRDLLPLQCEYCDKEFYVPKNQIQKFISRTKNKLEIRNQHKYCSKNCSKESKKSGIIIDCKNCNKKSYKQLREYNQKRNNYFCSHSCSTTWNNKNKTWGTNRSKLEKWLESELKIIFPKLEIKYNISSVIDKELDIYIPSLKLAFELNGIFHYEPIFGTEKLNGVKNSDNEKIEKCKFQSITLFIIDVREQRKFTIESSKKYLDFAYEKNNTIFYKIKNYLQMFLFLFYGFKVLSPDA